MSYILYRARLEHTHFQRMEACLKNEHKGVVFKFKNLSGDNKLYINNNESVPEIQLYN